MFFELNNLSQETSALRKALKSHTTPANELSHIECQQILAKAAGFQNLHACKAHLAQPRFRERHSPYLTGDPYELVDLVQRFAVHTEMKGFLESSESSWLSAYVESAHRMEDQLTYIRQGHLRVSAKLKTSLEKAESESLQMLHMHELSCLIKVKEVLWKGYSGECSDEEYDEAYADWRLASLSRWLRFSRTLPAHRKVENLVKRFDFYRLVAGLLADEGSDWLNQDEYPNAPVVDAEMRQVGKAVALQLLGGARLNERYFQAAYRVRAPANLDKIEDLWHQKFPEFRVWHIWSELKPILAPDADAFWAKRH